MGVGHWFGWVKDKLGKPVNQVWFVQSLNAEGTLFQVVRRRFFSDEQRFDRPLTRRAVVTKVCNTLIQDKAKKIQFVDVDSGHSMRFDGRNVVAMSPEELDANLTSDDVKAASSGGGVFDGTFVIVVGVLGLVAGLFIGVLFFPQILSAMGVSWW